MSNPESVPLSRETARPGSISPNAGLSDQLRVLDLGNARDKTVHTPNCLVDGDVNLGPKGNDVLSVEGPSEPTTQVPPPPLLTE